MNIYVEYYEAIENKKIALNCFNNADPDFIDVAIFNYNAAVERVNTLVKQMKKEIC